MKLSATDLGVLSERAILAASKAGQMVARARPQDIQRKPEGHSLASQMVTEIDRRSESIIIDTLNPTLEQFELGLLTEEQDDDLSRLTADNFWCIDPLDGTLPFVEGLSGYAVSVALVSRDGSPQVGVIYDPAEPSLWHAISGAGAFRDRVRWLGTSQPQGELLSVFADRSFFADDNYDVMVEALGRIAADMGLSGVRLHGTAGAVMNACGVLASPPACYFKHPKTKGGGNIWDFASSACLFREVGAVATDVYGDSLDLNRANSSSLGHRGVLFATDEALAAQIRAIPR